MALNAPPLSAQPNPQLSTEHTYSYRIASSTSINKLITKCLTNIFPSPPIADPPTSTPSITTSMAPTALTPPTRITILELTAKASAASKAITIVEIIKRRIDEQGLTWWQYTDVREILEEVPRWKVGAKKKIKGRKGKAMARQAKKQGDEAESKSKAGGKRKRKASEVADDSEEKASEEGEEQDDSEGDGEDPYKRLPTPTPYDSNDTKTRAVPVITIYLSRTRLFQHALDYGEQTNESMKK